MNRTSTPLTPKEYAKGALYFLGTLAGTLAVIYWIGSMAAYIKNAAN